MAANVVRRLVERVSGRDVRDQADGELPVRALQHGRPEAALDRGDVVDPHRPGRRRHGQPADLLDVAPLVLEHAHLDGILLGPFLVERNLVVAGHRQAQRVADGRHPHAEIGGALPIDGDVNLGVRDVQRDLDVGEARQLLRREQAPASSTPRSGSSPGPRMLAAIANPPVPSPLPSAFRDVIDGR